MFTVHVTTSCAEMLSGNHLAVTLALVCGLCQGEAAPSFSLRPDSSYRFPSPPTVHLEQWIATLAFPQPSSAEADVSPTSVLLLVTLLDVSVMVLLL